MAVKKQFAKNKQTCKVTFSISADEIQQGKKVVVVGDFNNWDQSQNPLRKSKTGFSTSVSLDTQKQYQFKYLVDNVNWLNDSQADGYSPSPFGNDNSIVNL